MSWFSRIEGNLARLATGNKATLPIINNPTTPLEKSINAAGAVILPVAAAIPGVGNAAISAAAIGQALDQVKATATSGADPVSGLMAVIGQGAHSALDDFLTNHIGVQATGFTEDALKTVAVIALSRLQAAQGTSPNAIGSALSDMLKGFATPAA